MKIYNQQQMLYAEGINNLNKEKVKDFLDNKVHHRMRCMRDSFITKPYQFDPITGIALANIGVDDFIEFSIKSEINFFKHISPIDTYFVVYPVLRGNWLPIWKNGDISGFVRVEKSYYTVAAFGQNLLNTDLSQIGNYS